MRRVWAVVLFSAAVVCVASGAQSQQPPQDLKMYVPSTISPAARESYRVMLSAPPSPPARADDLHAEYLAGEKDEWAMSAPVMEKLKPSVTPLKLGGVDVLDVRPQGYVNDGTLLIYVHGGGFVLFSAHSSLAYPAMMGGATGKRVITVDYTIAPDGKWQRVTDQVIAVYKALLAQGHAAKSIGLFGESAGGDILAASVLKLRDAGLPMPGGLLLISPVTDLTLEGDSEVTLSKADPEINVEDLRVGYDAYAARAEQKNPYVSPVYGDFAKGYPPTLIQGGTKELLLSDFVRLNTAIKAAGGKSELVLYEGMMHAFPPLVFGSPECDAELKDSAEFWKKTLRRR